MFTQGSAGSVIGEYGSSHSSLRRCTSKRFAKVKYLRSLRRRRNGLDSPWGDCEKDTGSFPREILLYSRVEHGYLLFGCLTETVDKSRKIVCDASFKYRPQDTYQVYRVFCFVGETHCNATWHYSDAKEGSESCDKMWSKLSEALEAYFDDVGQLVGVKAKRARDVRKNKDESDDSSESDSDSDDEQVALIEQDAKELLSFIEVGTKSFDHSK
uniref:Uncharacterized protein n=1 Tax=Ditylenchus dipsaci TaxID=166011 RepID=A0A915DX08_9BILA